MTIYSTLLPSPFGLLTISATCDGVRSLSFEDKKGENEIGAKPGDRHPLNYLELCTLSPHCKEQRVLQEAAASLRYYFEGRTVEFSLPLAPSGTPFQRSVWRLLTTIPYGETKSYGWIAEQLGMRSGARAVGGACGSNPIPIIIPCHRVIASNGAIGGYSGGGIGEGLSTKKRLLALEGVTV
ncbi:MAG: methylated-DNA--[protein]-cysteine S-methyltransferase [Deltaproteobacteria bacterium]|nr:methylated-DNA--[protein]-cysteine S-methyltransferase [Deltaproteobacteria bacterium]